MYVIDLLFINNNNRKKLAISSPRTRSCWNDEMMDKMDFTTILVYSVSLQFVCFLLFSFSYLLTYLFFCSRQYHSACAHFPYKGKKISGSRLLLYRKTNLSQHASKQKQQDLKAHSKAQKLTFFWWVSEFSRIGYWDCLSG